MHPVAWLKAHPRGADAILALTVTAITVAAEVTLAPEDVGGQPDAPGPSAISVVLVVLGNLPLLWRRTNPGRCITVIGTALLAYTFLGYQGGGVLGVGIIVALYSVAAHGPDRRQATAALVITMIAIAATMVHYGLTDDSSGIPLLTLVSNVVIFATAWILGDNLRQRRAHVAGLEQRAEALEREQQAEARRAVLVERGRVARELHDVVAHHVSVMVVQAGGARRVLATQPERASEALSSIETTGRQALDELRRILGMLRAVSPPGTDTASLEPQPTLAAVADLVEQTRHAGVDVDLRVEGPPRPLPPGVDLSAYRIVQEALTNTIKHAGKASARVAVRYGADGVEVEVVDDGNGAAAADGGGHGLLGMRERVELFGGELAAGPRAGGGFGVRAWLPA